MAIINPTTPGVYIDELQSFPPSVAAVSTAIPAFIGYTEKGPSTPTRITSMLEYQSTFGGPYDELYTATLDTSGNLASTGGSDSTYVLFYHLQMYFGNGGGPCYIISVGNYTDALAATDFYDPGDPTKGVGAAEEVDEVTLLVMPEIMQLASAADIRSIQDFALAQCDQLKDRFCIFDVKAGSTPNPVTDGNNFRNTAVSANNLSYGAAYYPPLDTILHRNYSNDQVIITDPRVGLAKVYDEPNNTLATVLQGVGRYGAITISASSTGTLTITSGATSRSFTTGVDFPAAPTSAEVVAAINQSSLNTLVRAQVDTATVFFVVVRAGTSATGSLTLAVGGGTRFSITTAATGGVDNSANTGLYTSITNALGAKVLTLGPSSSMAGIYAAVDSDRGVWKAPANVSVANIIGPNVPVTESQQGGLNVDPVGGKSINVIRAFTGRGTLVWGARTLDGNSNEWRYVPVRRLFIMTEESVKKACEFVVFEPNDKNTWLRVKGLVSNFLTDLWRQGALAGAKPEQAFFVQAGLGETMDAQDILEGRLIVRIGMAAVRPAEFIILQFVQQLQQN